MTAFPLLIEGAFKATLLIAAAGLVVLARRGATASLRHLIWSWSLVSMLAIPALSVVVPRWQVGIIAPPAESPGLPTLTERAVASTPASPGVVDRSGERDWNHSFMLLWLGGVVAGLITTVGGLLTLRRITQGSRTLAEPEWTQLVSKISRDLGITRPVRMVIAQSAAMPATWGIFRPTVLLPADAESWNEERRRVVLLHELAHVRRKDALMQVVAQFCCAVYWFHPGVWYAARRLRSERELACDEHVLGAGVNACDYAAHLLEIARRFRTPADTSLAVAMARPSQLEGRLVAILTETSSVRFKATPRARAATVVALVTLSLPVAAMRPWKTPVAEPSPKVAAPITTAEPTDTIRWKGIVPAVKGIEALPESATGQQQAGLRNDTTQFDGNPIQGHNPNPDPLYNPNPNPVYNPNPKPAYNPNPDPGYNANPDPGYNANPDPGYNANPDPEDSPHAVVRDKGRGPLVRLR